MNQSSALESIFFAAMAKRTPADRAAYLDEACRADAALRNRVERMLHAETAAGSFLETPLQDLASDDDPSEIIQRPGSSIGPYKLLQQIGEGGMGVVFMAEQQQPVRRQVALKVIKPGMDTRQVISRFDAERQALALMDHPNIAKVLDAGATENGRPYFVLELVKGVPIIDYCDQEQLSLRQRLELLISVCHAVQHAHQKGIIHRDLKPSNVLVAEYDGQPVPKIIDFGVAKAIGPQLTERTMFTQYGQLIGTFEYMSPEQARFNQLDVDTRSDIYSLGVLLYELLTGETPFDRQRLRSASFDEALRIIREEEPPRPSTRLSALSLRERAGVRARSSGEPSRTSSGPLPLAGRDQMSTGDPKSPERSAVVGREASEEGESACETGALDSTIAEHRRTDARRLSQQVRSELDWIVMKCLEKYRNRRYETADGLARDIERYLNDDPVQACPPSASYRFRKFARRNKTLLAAGSAIAAALVIGLGLSTWMYFRERAAVAVAKANEMRATTESARVKAISALLQENRIQLGELLTREQRAVLRPEDARRLSMNAATRTEEARRQIRQAIEAYGQVAIEYPGDFELRAEAARGFVEIIKVCIATPGFANEVEEANRRLEAELPALRAAFSDSSECQRRTAHIYTEWSNELLPYAAYLPTVEHAISESIEIAEKLLDSEPNWPSLWLSLANMYVWLGDTQWRFSGPENGEAAFRRALEIYDEHAAEIAAEIAANARESTRISGDYVRLAYYLACTHRQDEAAEFVRQAALHAKRITDPVESFTASIAVALVQLRLGDLDGFRKSCKAIADIPVADADDLTKVRSIMPCCCGPDPLSDMSLFVNRAEQLVAKNLLGKPHVVLYVSGAALYRAGQYDRAAGRLEESIDAYPSDPPPGDDIINYQRLLLAMTKWKQGQQNAARRLFAETLPALDNQIQSPSCYWFYRLGLEVLRSEAVAMIEPKEADEEVENKNNSSSPTTDN